MFQPTLTMNTVLACVDAHGHPSAVCDGATWAAQHLHAPLNFLQVIDESEAHTGETRFSDLTGYDPGTTRTQALDAMPGSHIIGGQSHSQQLLEGVRARALHLGHTMVELSLRQGKLTDALLDLSNETRLLVMGLHSHHLDSPWRQDAHHLEQALHAVQQPLLVVTRSHFTPPSAFALAYHGGPESLQLVDAVAKCELLHGLPCHLVHAGARNADIQAEMTQAAQRLADAGVSTHIVIESGDVEQVMARHLTIQQLPLLVMSAFTHTGWRQKLLGTTTSTLLRRTPTSVLVLR
ncbi:universal stress protein [Aquabacterium sp.]|uniref:universal stress protein n=1 Tax=Aquabacterium sp. TaxID=1872578 RepID=UPI0027B8FA4C|nr:universal stress protein [Aquabacterium sp.]